jgi:hypothetical protein
VSRGNCSFLEKATNAYHAGAQAIIICNNEDKIEPFASGLGINPNITADMVTLLDKFPVVCNDFP